MTVLGTPQLRLLGPAAVEDIRAAGMKTAALGRIGRARHLAFQDDALPCRTRLGHRDGRQQRFRIGMHGRGEDISLWRELDDLAEIHHRHAMRDVLDNGEIVADEQQREAELPLQVLQQIDDLRLDRDVERRNRFVADDQVGFRRECPGDTDTLALTA